MKYQRKENNFKKIKMRDKLAIVTLIKASYADSSIITTPP